MKPPVNPGDLVLSTHKRTQEKEIWIVKEIGTHSMTVYRLDEESNENEWEFALCFKPDHESWIDKILDSELVKIYYRGKIDEATSS